MKIFAVIVTYNGKKWYSRCFGSLLKSSIPVDIVVIDNASSDDTVEYIKGNYPMIHLIASAVNHGFTKANNIGIKYALDNGADYVFLLNQDAWVEEKTLEILLKTFEDCEKVGVASPIHLNGSYTGMDYGFCDCVGPLFISDAYLGKLQSYYETPFVNAAAWLLSKECILKVGGFDTCLFKHYGEDDNYSQRVIYHGLRTIINTRTTICHDRENRIAENIGKNKFNNGDPYFWQKYSKGNILLEYDAEKQIQDIQKSILKAYLRLHLKHVRGLKKDIDFEKQIAYSRSQNIKGGLVWL